MKDYKTIRIRDRRRDGTHKMIYKKVPIKNYRIVRIRDRRRDGTHRMIHKKVPIEVSNENIDYKVGYGNPPKEHQFKKGESGNPSGRPRGTRNKKATQDHIYDLLNKKITVKTENGMEEIYYSEAAARKFLEISMSKGQFQYFKAIFEIEQKVGDKRRREEPDEEVGAIQKTICAVFGMGNEEAEEIYKEEFGTDMRDDFPDMVDDEEGED